MEKFRKKIYSDIAKSDRILRYVTMVDIKRLSLLENSDLFVYAIPDALRRVAKDDGTYTFDLESMRPEAYIKDDFLIKHELELKCKRILMEVMNDPYSTVYLVGPVLVCDMLLGCWGKVNGYSNFKKYVEGLLGANIADMQGIYAKAKKNLGGVDIKNISDDVDISEDSENNMSEDELGIDIQEQFKQFEKQVFNFNTAYSDRAMVGMH